MEEDPIGSFFKTTTHPLTLDCCHHPVWRIIFEGFRPGQSILNFLLLSNSFPFPSPLSIIIDLKSASGPVYKPSSCCACACLGTFHKRVAFTHFQANIQRSFQSNPGQSNPIHSIQPILSYPSQTTVLCRQKSPPPPLPKK